VVLSRSSNFDDLQPELGGFSIEMDDLLVPRDTMAAKLARLMGLH
jgi:hypothetical protein